MVMTDPIVANAEKIHTTAMAVLEKTGVKVHDPEICTMLKKNGVRIDHDIAFFNENQVLSWVQKAPSQFTLHARNPAYDALIGGGQPQYAAGYGCAEIVDAAGQRRMATLRDYIRFVQLVHQSKGFNLNGGILVQPTELPVTQSHLAMTYATLLYSDKCLMGQPGRAEAEENILTMVAIACGGRQALMTKPRLLTLVNTLSPLQIDRVALETIKIHATSGQALLIAAGVMSGTTAPITTAGALALGTAEVLAAIAITQMIREGTPVVMGLVVSPADMSTAAVRLGVPGHASGFRYIRALANLYHLPCRCGGSVTDANKLNHQSGYESMLNMLATRQSGIDLILHSAGILDSFKAMSFEKFVADTEAIRIIDQYLADITVSEDSLALGVIETVGPGGEYLTTSHTLSHCRKFPFKSTLANAIDPENTLIAADRFTARAAATADKILQAYHPPELSPEQQDELETFLISQGLEAAHLETIKRAFVEPVSDNRYRKQNQVVPPS